MSEMELHQGDEGKPSLPWWKSTVIYQIYPRSFKDSNGDGIGDIPGLRIMIDFVPNHTSTQHVWFQKSLKKDGKYTDYYVWTDGKTLPDGSNTVPNNWMSVFGGSAWQWSQERQQYYYHAFVPEQADLNYRNPDVQEEMMLLVRYWLDLGVDGMRVDAIANLYESEDLSQDHLPSGKDVPPTDWEYYDAIHTDFLPECKDEIKRWQTVFKDKKREDGEERLMVLEFYTDSDTRGKMAEYEARPFNMDLIDGLTSPPSARSIMGLIAQEYTNKPESYWPIFVAGNHDRKRVATRFGPQYVDAFNLLLMTLKGTPTTYYGEELGMEDITVSFEDTQDPFGLRVGPERYTDFSRDGCRSPMQWAPGPNANFTSAQKPWLPVADDHTSRNVENQKHDARSHMNLYKEYVSLRQQDAFKYGDIDVNCVLNDNVLSFLRFYRSDRYLVVINLGQNSTTDDHSGAPVNTHKATVVSNTAAVTAHLDKGQAISLDSVTLRPGDGIVLKL